MEVFTIHPYCSLSYSICNPLVLTLNLSANAIWHWRLHTHSTLLASETHQCYYVTLLTHFAHLHWPILFHIFNSKQDPFWNLNSTLSFWQLEDITYFHLSFTNSPIQDHTFVSSSHRPEPCSKWKPGNHCTIKSPSSLGKQKVCPPTS